MARTCALILFGGLAQCVELLGQLALLVSSGILVDDAVADSLVNLLGSEGVSNLSCFLIARSKCCLVLLECGVQLAAEDLVLKGLNLSNSDALLCRFDVCH